LVRLLEIDRPAPAAVGASTLREGDGMTSFSLEEAAATGQKVEPRWDAQRTEQNLERARARRRVRTVRVRVATGLAVLSAFVVLLLVLRASPSPESSTVAPAHRSAPASPVADPRTTFADGSTARVSDGGELVVQSASEQRIEAVLAAGTADFEVTKRANREFLVVAGPIRVRVVGTKFRVELAGERARVEVLEGKVEVQRGDARAFMEAGESRWFPGAEPTPKPEDPPPAVTTDRARFLEFARAERFTDAYQLMSRSPSAVGGSAEELLLAADAARHSNHPEQALGFLRRVTKEHGSDSRAPLAAFTLGRLLLNQLGRPAEAAEAFALVPKLRPSGGLVEDALARQAEALAAAGERVRASGLAAEYVRRYPQGKHLATMQRVAAKQ
jgi:transmembrane sensor